MLPKTSVCLHIPKTGTRYVAWFFNAADWLELRRACGLRRPVLPRRPGIELAKRIKRHGPAFGNLNCRLANHHAPYSAWPPALRGHLKLCVLRDVRTWYRSFHLYYTGAMTGTLLSRAIRLIVDGHDRERDASFRTLALRHRQAFRERFEGEDATARALENVSAEFLFWFMRAIRTPLLAKRWLGADTVAPGLGFLGLRAVMLLFERPARVLALPAEDLDAYFASGRYRADLRCDAYLRFESLTEALGELMTGALGYDPRIVRRLQRHAPRKNVSPAHRKPRVDRELAENGLLGRIREEERIYERYLLPLAGARTDGPGAGLARPAAPSAPRKPTP